MRTSTNMIDKAFDLLLKLTDAEERLLQSEGAIWLKDKLGLAPDHPPDNFDGVYTYTLVEYAVDEATGRRRPNALLAFFRNDAIRKFIRRTYDQDVVPEVLLNDIATLLDGAIGQELNAQGIDLKAEMQRFEAIFTDVVRRTRTPKDVRQEKELTRSLQRLEQQQQQNHEALQAALEKVHQLTGSTLAALPGSTEAETEASALVQQVKAWFKAVEYGEGDYAHSGEGYCEWMITVPARRGEDRIVVRCVDGEAQVNDLESLLESVEDQDADEGWLCYGSRMSKAAKTKLEERKYRDLYCYTLDELIDQKADFSNYLTWLEQTVKARGIDTDYVQLACKKDDVDLATQRKIGTSRYAVEEGGIAGYVDEWLEDDSKEHLSVLGEFGTGKTWFTLHYAWVALQKYQEAKAKNRPRPRLPLVIPLRDYARALDVENVIAGFFFSQHNIDLTGKIFDELNRLGKLLLIFDGFDEMATRVDKQAMINNFWQLARVVRSGAKAILTCRTEHFPDARQGRKLLSAQLQASTQNLTGEPPQFEVLELEKFNRDQIRTMLLNKTSEATAEKVLDSEKLIELAERPVMVDLILDALPKIETLDNLSSLDMSRVYLYAVTRRLERDWQEQRTFTSLADKLYFLCEVSWEMLKTEQMSLHFRSFPERLERLFGDKVKEQNELDHWHYDMMGQAMLVRDDEGNYRPAHRSLLEFFAAYKIVAALGVLAPEFLEIAKHQSHIDAHAEPQAYQWDQYFFRQCEGSGEPIPIAPLQAFAAVSFEQIVTLIGESKLAKAVLDLAHSMLDPTTMRERLLSFVQQTRNQTADEVGYTGSNLIQLALRQDNDVLEQADLSHTRLPEVDFANASLRRLSLRQTRLQTATFTKVLGLVLSVTYSPDGRLLAIGDSNGTVQVWDARTYQVLMLVKGHEDWVRSVAFSGDGQTLASASDDKTVRLWSVATHQQLATLKGHEDLVSSVAFSGDGQTLASASADKTVRLWSVATHQQLATLKGHEDSVSSVAFSGDGQTLASASTDQTVRLWSVATHQQLATLKGHESSVMSVAFSGDGQTLASAS
ncbi:MAG: pentapeptide repeat-containing protein, partial [Cyanobacteria bacterium J06638_20]